MIKSFNTLSGVLALVALTSAASAAVLNLGSYTKTTDGDQSFSTVFNGGAQLFNYTSGNVYVTFDLTFTNPVTPGTLDTSSSYGGYSHSANDVFGQMWQQSVVGIAYYGDRPKGVSIVTGTTMTLVVKYELNGAGLDGDTVKFWINPTLGTPEGPVVDTPTTDGLATRLWNPQAITSDDMRFRRGNGSDNHLAFTNVTVYSGGDSPFAAVPEPSATVLAGLGVLGLLRRRRAGM